MRFGVFYELQLPKPWNDGDEHQLFQDALAQIRLADDIGIDYAWAVEHHFLDEYSHCSAPEVFLAAAAAQTKNIKIGHGIRQVIPNYNHPARVAEGLAALDLISNGRVQFGIGEGATRMELHGFGIDARAKRAMALEAAEQIANMMVMDPYPGYESDLFPCRAVMYCPNLCRRRIRRCGWPAPTAIPSRSRHPWVWERWPFPSSIPKRPATGAGFTMTS